MRTNCLRIHSNLWSTNNGTKNDFFLSKFGFVSQHENLQRHLAWNPNSLNCNKTWAEKLVNNGVIFCPGRSAASISIPSRGKFGTLNTRELTYFFSFRSHKVHKSFIFRTKKVSLAIKYIDYHLSSPAVVSRYPSSTSCSSFSAWPPSCCAPVPLPCLSFKDQQWQYDE